MTYDLTGSLDKNKDVLPQNILFVMKSKDIMSFVLHQPVDVKKKWTMVTAAPVKSCTIL